MLDPKFFARSALEVAPDLLGCRLMCGDRSLVLTEIEAYLGEEDLASHARFGPTPRNAVMFGPPAYWYLYLIYGMYWMLNVVVEKEGQPAALLIRGTREISGPGRLTRDLGLDQRYHEQPLSEESGLWIAERLESVSADQILQTPRIGIDYAGEWKDKPFRFVLES